MAGQRTARQRQDLKGRFVAGASLVVCVLQSKGCGSGAPAVHSVCCGGVPALRIQVAGWERSGWPSSDSRKAPYARSSI